MAVKEEMTGDAEQRGCGDIVKKTELSLLLT